MTEQQPDPVPADDDGVLEGTEPDENTEDDHGRDADEGDE